MPRARPVPVWFTRHCDNLKTTEAVLEIANFIRTNEQIDELIDRVARVNGSSFIPWSHRMPGSDHGTRKVQRRAHCRFIGAFAYTFFPICWKFHPWHSPGYSANWMMITLSESKHRLYHQT